MEHPQNSHQGKVDNNVEDSFFENDCVGAEAAIPDGVWSEHTVSTGGTFDKSSLHINNGLASLARQRGNFRPSDRPLDSAPTLDGNAVGAGARLASSMAPRTALCGSVGAARMRLVDFQVALDVHVPVSLKPPRIRQRGDCRCSPHTASAHPGSSVEPRGTCWPKRG